ncbi:MAG TPA: helix-turn-helix transcriptional regulator, partial [Bacteroidales bacterium]|nr:helix-turn-helix transcriptional regulator [Bacteroidales bacterium]
MAKKENRGIGSSYVSELTKLRISSGLSLMEVEELTGIDYRVVSDWETGKVRTPKVADPKKQSSVILLCELYDITMLQFEYFMNEAYYHAHKEEFMS